MTKKKASDIEFEQRRELKKIAWNLNSNLTEIQREANAMFIEQYKRINRFNKSRR